MHLHDGSLRLSATDLSNHLHCHHLTRLSRAVACGESERPSWSDPRAEVLRERGYEHEARYLEDLRRARREVVALDEGDGGDLVARTIELMREGVDVIAQGALGNESWYGRPDVLLRADRAALPETRLGPWCYEVVDTKLARETRGATILQLCLYSELVESVQGETPEGMHVVSPAEVLARESFRVADYLAYYRWIKRRLEAAVAPESENDETYPEPVEHCQVCAYWRECDARRRADDHLSLVAGASRGQRRELVSQGIGTLARLAAEPIPLEWKPTRGAPATYEKTREQARVQLEARALGGTYFELLDVEPERGLTRLPVPTSADVFFDFEGDAFVGTAGLEYVFGWVTTGGSSAHEYHYLWATEADSEKRNFESFVDAMIERLESTPGFHIYHFTAYEPAGLKRLMGRYATREAEVDRLLRAEVFVDLHSITRQALRAGVEKYSLKDLEPYFGFERQLELADARRALFRVERMLELGKGDEIEPDVRANVLRYNREDCESTRRLRDWLETLRAERSAEGEPVERPAPPKSKLSDKGLERQQLVEALMQRLLVGIAVDERERDEEQRGRWLLAHLLDYHRREKKVNWWELFRLQELDEEELAEESVGVAGLEFLEEVDGGTSKRPIHRYRFERQEVKLRPDQDVRLGEAKVGDLADFDLGRRTIDVKKIGKWTGGHPKAVFVHSDIPLGRKPESLFRLGESVATEGWDIADRGRAARDLLLRLPPRIPERAWPVGVGSGETSVDAAKRLALELDRGVLPIQGPPGSGKTYTGSRMALELIRAGKRVGVSATSHKVMRNFMNATREAAGDGPQPRCVHRDRPEKYAPGWIDMVHPYDKIERMLAEGEIDILAGTPWLWAKSEFEAAVDVLFIDEAGQMSLADVLACAQGASSLVLLGDPQQLEQPQQGSHPESTHVSALEHLLRGEDTLPDGAGLFLEKTYRLHPDICRFTSELFYERRLESIAGLERQSLEGPVLTGAGLWYLPVEHEGNQSASAEEVVEIAELVTRLTDGSTSWTNQEGEVSQLRLDQILIVAPYNAQVQHLEERLPDGARVGTVNRFQGQEAPLVIFSTATSSPDLAPRGMEFLYDSSRLNVATSRARAACVLVGSPLIFEPECKTPRQMKLANAFCRYLELATRLAGRTRP